jgi:hypothetical protein
MRLFPVVNRFIESGEESHNELVLIPIEYPYVPVDVEFLKIILSPKLPDVPIVGNAELVLLLKLILELKFREFDILPPCNCKKFAYRVLLYTRLSYTPIFVVVEANIGVDILLKFKLI